MSGLAKYFNSRLYVNVAVLHFEHLSQVFIKKESRALQGAQTLLFFLSF